MHDQSPSVSAERIRLLFRQAPLVLAVSAVNAALVAYALWRPDDRARLLGWVGTLLLVTLLRAVLWLRFRRRQPGDGEMGAWGLGYTVGSAASGLLWGATALLFLEPGEPLRLLLVAFVVGGMAAGAVAGLSSHLPAIYSYLVASVTPLAARLVAEGSRTGLTMAALTVVFVAGMALIGRNFNRSLTARLELGEEKRRLAEILEQQVRERTVALQSANDQLAGILSTTEDHVFMICWSGALLYASPSALHDFAAADGGVAGKRWSDLGLPPDEAALLEALHRRVMETGAPVTGEITHQTPRGPRRHEYKFNPMASADRPVGAVIAVSRDVTEHIHTALALEEARAAAERADQAKSRFLAAASHDLRQPMQSMFLFAGALRPRIADAQGQEMLTMLERGLDTLKGLLDSLLDVSRLDANVVEPNIATFAVRPFLDEIVAAYQPIAASRGLGVRVGESCQVQVRSDATLLGRMVRNLVENAIRYTERGGIVTDCRVDGEHVLIEVRDTGIGIPPDQLERIFEEFHQVDNPGRDKARGLGLGLAIVQRLSGILNHPVQVRSAPGRGSVFSIRVPLDSTPLPSTEPEASAAPQREGKLVVLVDDDAIVLLGLRATLEGIGYRTVIAGSIEQALERLSSDGRVPDLIISDYRLRGGAVGTDAILAIRAHAGHPVPGIILTGETGSECTREAAEHGFSIIHKPVTPRQLTACLQQLTGSEGGA